MRNSSHSYATWMIYTIQFRSFFRKFKLIIIGKAIFEAVIIQYVTSQGCYYIPYGRDPLLGNNRNKKSNMNVYDALLGRPGYQRDHFNIKEHAPKIY